MLLKIHIQFMFIACNSYKQTEARGTWQTIVLNVQVISEVRITWAQMVKHLVRHSYLTFSAVGTAQARDHGDVPETMN